MNFGFSLGDFITLPTFAWKVYEAYRDAPTEFQRLSTDIAALHAILNQTQALVSEDELDTANTEKLTTVGKGCYDVLQELESLHNRYRSLATNDLRALARVRMALEDVQGIRQRLTASCTLLNTFHSSFTSHSVAEIKNILNHLAAGTRAGNRPASIVSIQTIESLSREDKEAWRAVRKNLNENGISTSFVVQNQQMIIDCLKEAFESISEERRDMDPSCTSLGHQEQTIREPLSLRDSSFSDLTDLEQIIRNIYIPAESATRPGALELVPPLPVMTPGDKQLPSLPPGADVTAEELHHAASSGDIARVASALRQPTSMLHRDDGQITCHAAEEAGHEAIVRLPENPADIDALVSASDESDGLTALQLAVLDANEAVACRLLEGGACVHARNNQTGSTALHLAASKGCVRIVQLLLTHGAELLARNAIGDTALHDAARNGHEAVARVLLKNIAHIFGKNKCGDTALHYAARNGHVGTVRALLENGANLHEMNGSGDTVFHCAAWKGHVLMVRVLLANGADASAINSIGETALHYAAQHGHLTVAQLLVEDDMLVHSKSRDGDTALHYAARYGQVAMVHLLLLSKANIQAMNCFGVTALHSAVQYGHVATAQLLLKDNTIIHKEDSEGETALHYAARYGHVAMVRLLLENKADIEATDYDGNTALHVAASRPSRALVKLLLEKGAKVDATDLYGRTTSDLATSEGYDSVVPLFIAVEKQLAQQRLFSSFFGDRANGSRMSKA